MTSTYIESGGRIRVYDSSVHTHANLPVGTYRVSYNAKEGFSLLRVDNLKIGVDRVYGVLPEKVERIWRRFELQDKSVGSLFSGDKGQGKTLIARMVCDRAIKSDVPVVLVKEDADGIAEFLDSLGECVIVFDEFEKTFPIGSRSHQGYDDSNRQVQFLSLLDGLSEVKRLYLFTVNDATHVSDMILNRPGRAHFHFRFKYPDADEIREYLSEKAPNASSVEIDNVVRFAANTKVSYDSLSAIAIELNDPGARFAEIVQDMNIKPTEPNSYRIEVAFSASSNLKPMIDEVQLNLFEKTDQQRTIQVGSGDRNLYISFAPKDLEFPDNGSINLPITATDLLDEDDEFPEDAPTSITLRLIGQHSYAFDAL